MQKKDLMTGMTCVLRSGDRYIVMLETGFGGRMEIILWKPNILQSSFGQWMSLDDYREDFSFRECGNEDDWLFDIEEVYKFSGPVNIGNIRGADAEQIFKGGE